MRTYKRHKSITIDKKNSTSINSARMTTFFIHLAEEAENWRCNDTEYIVQLHIVCPKEAGLLRMTYKWPLDKFWFFHLSARGDEIDEINGQTLAKGGGFSLHAGVSAKSHQRSKVERLCHYIARPAVSTHRMEILADGSISYELKTPYKNGTTHVVFEPLDFIARLAALVPKPRFHLTRFHGVFAPNSKHRARVTGDSKEKQVQLTSADCGVRRGKMSWAMRLKRVFNIDITVCRHCQWAVRIIACIEDAQVINKILSHMNKQRQALAPVSVSSGIRAPPTASYLLLNH